MTTPSSAYPTYETLPPQSTATTTQINTNKNGYNKQGPYERSLRNDNNYDDDYLDNYDYGLSASGFGVYEKNVRQKAAVGPDPAPAASRSQYASMQQQENMEYARSSGFQPMFPYGGASGQQEQHQAELESGCWIRYILAIFNSIQFNNLY